jgi:alkylation response protein AidB-like acyl-CoA dehydrogenase
MEFVVVIHIPYVYRCKGSKENRIGEDGFGFAFAMNVLNGGRIGIASQALGIAELMK